MANIGLALTREQRIGYKDVDRTEAVSLAGRTTAPVKIWATIGALWLIYSVYAFGGWILGPDFKTVPTGADPVPNYIYYWTHGIEIFGISALFACLYGFVIKPWRRTGEISWDGMFCLACLSMYVQDSWTNYTTPFFLYNSEFINFGNWANYVPGWISPNGHLLPEPLIGFGTTYVWFIMVMVVFVCWGLNKVKAKSPNIGTLGLVLCAFSFLAVFDFVMEYAFIGMGLWAYPTTIPWLTVWAGKTYQFPLYEAVLWPAAWTALVMLRYFRDDKGLSFAERGTERLRLSGAGKSWTRFLAVVGACQIIFFLIYNVPMQWFAMHGGPLPKGFPSYMMNGICGEGTGYDCAGYGVPIPRSDGPTNRIVVPEAQTAQ